MNRLMCVMCGLLLALSFTSAQADQEQRAERRRFLSQPAFKNNQNAQIHIDKGAIPPKFEDREKQLEVDGNSGDTASAANEAAAPVPVEAVTANKLTTATAKENASPPSATAKKAMQERAPASSGSSLWALIGFLALLGICLGWFFLRKNR